MGNIGSHVDLTSGWRGHQVRNQTVAGRPLRASRPTPATSTSERQSLRSPAQISTIPRCAATTTACVRSLTPNRRRMMLTCHFTVPLVILRASAIS